MKSSCIINQDIDERKRIKYKQSANTLFNFMQKIDYLYDKLENKRIMPRYVSEDVQYLNVPSFLKFQVPMTCFCDINLHKISLHARGDGTFSGYGDFAIAFSKDFALKNSITPIQYINDRAELFKALSSALNFALNFQKTDEQNFEQITDYLVKALMFIKPLTGNQDNKPKNFHDEHEWRFVPNMNGTDMPQFLTNGNACKFYNEALLELMKKIDESGGKTDICLNFEYSDIKYLIIDKEETRPEFIKWIMNLRNTKNICEEECLDLISKIQILDTIVEDA